MKSDNDTGTEFNEQTTTHGGNENGIPMMSERGARLAAKSAPQSAFKVAERTEIADAPRNPLQDSLHEIFKRSPL
jgi:hypothetical protein